MIDLTCNCVVWISVIVTLVAEASFMAERHVSIPQPFQPATSQSDFNNLRYVVGPMDVMIRQKL